MTSQNTIQPEEHIFPIYDLYGNLKRYVKHMVWEVGPCLLYTSPSPRDATLSRMPSSA